jgi:hypothetical protein
MYSIRQENRKPPGQRRRPSVLLPSALPQLSTTSLPSNSFCGPIHSEHRQTMALPAQFKKALACQASDTVGLPCRSLAKAGRPIHSEMRTISSSSSACSTQGSGNASRPDFVKICAIRVSRSRRLPAGGQGHLQCRRHVGKCRQMSVNVGVFFTPPTP